jgi:hypothetical protein
VPHRRRRPLVLRRQLARLAVVDGEHDVRLRPEFAWLSLNLSPCVLSLRN